MQGRLMQLVTARPQACRKESQCVFHRQLLEGTVVTASVSTTWGRTAIEWSLKNISIRQSHWQLTTPLCQQQQLHPCAIQLPSHSFIRRSAASVECACACICGHDPIKEHCQIRNRLNDTES